MSYISCLLNEEQNVTMNNLYPTIHKFLIKNANSEDLIRLLKWINESLSNKIEYLVAEDIWVKSMNYVPKVTFVPPTDPFSTYNRQDLSS